MKSKAIQTDAFTMLCKSELNTDCVKELQFCKGRRWRFDYALPDFKIALEVEGGIFVHGRHTRPQGFYNDMEKYNTATTLGWVVVRTIPRELYTQKTLDLLLELIKIRQK